MKIHPEPHFLSRRRRRRRRRVLRLLFVKLRPIVVFEAIVSGRVTSVNLGETDNIVCSVWLLLQRDTAKYGVHI
jgi:hypothetical protein